MYKEASSDVADGPSTGIASENHAIPSIEDVPRLIQLCHELSTSEGKSQLRFQGLEGAAWVAVYAGIVLGFRVVLQDEVGKQTLLFGQEQDVNGGLVVEPCWENSRVQLEVNGNLFDWINVSCINRRSVQNWGISCDDTSYLRLQLTETYELLDSLEVSELLSMLSMQELHHIVGQSNYGKGQTHPKYLSSALPKLQERALHILKILGADLPPVGSVKQISEYPVDNFPGIATTSIYEDLPFDQWETHCGCLIEGYLTTYMTTCTKVSHGRAKARVIEKATAVLLVVLRYATRLAFTDWHDKLRRLPAACSKPVPLVTPKDLEEEASFYAWRAPIRSGYQENRAGGNNRLSHHFADGWLARDVDGVVLIRNQALGDNISNTEGILLSFVPGQILFEGQPRTTVISDPRSGTIKRLNVWEETPSSKFQDRFLFSGLKDVIKMSHELSYKGRFEAGMIGYLDDIEVSRSIRNVEVLPHCQHTSPSHGKYSSAGEGDNKISLRVLRHHESITIFILSDLECRNTQLELSWIITTARQEGLIFSLIQLHNLCPLCSEAHTREIEAQHATQQTK